MIPISALSPRAWLGLAAGLAFALLLAWALRLDNRRAHWHAIADAFAAQAGKVTLAIEHATGEEADWDNAPGAIVALGENYRGARADIDRQSEAIDALARDAVRRRAEAAELRQIVDRAQAQRSAALKKLSDLTITPGTRKDCVQLLREANDALDLARENEA